MNTPHDVVITGLGLVTPLGNNVQENWNSLMKGRSGLSFFDHPDVDRLPCKVVGQVRNEQEALNEVFHPKHQRKTDRFIHLAILAAHEAMNDAGLSQELPASRDRFGSYLGVGVGGLNTYLESARAYAQGGPKKISPFMIPKSISNEAASWLSMLWDLRGPQIVMVSACSSSADAIGYAYRQIKDGYADYMLVGGTESCISPESIAAFGNMRALSSWQGDPAQASRPFSHDRTGFVMGEGAGVMVLERADLARERGATIYAQVAGFGATADAYHITAMHPQGRGAIAAMKGALKEAALEPHDIGYINAHGTGTPMNDTAESAVISEVFGDHAKPQTDNHLLVSSTKSMTGHMLGAAGGVEISYAALALKHQMVPPTINCETPGQGCDLDYVLGQAREHSFDAALSSSFGFGGGNAVVVLKRWAF